MHALVVDIDGTIADNTHRLHYIKGKKKDYDSFYSAMDKDLPKHDVIWLIDLIINAWRKCGDFDIFVCSGRPEDYRDLTEKWLIQHTLDLYEVAETIMLRKSGDSRKDSIVKDEMRQHIEKQGYTIRAVLDDRQQTVDMWRENGITCLQVEQWDE